MNSDFILNEAQSRAVETTEGFVRVVAGAGSGKTRTLAMRFAWLCELGMLPENILSITFTNKAAGEMKRRIRNLIGEEESSTVCTFHSLCSMILREDAHVVHYPKSFAVLDGADIDDILKVIYEENGMTLRDMSFSKAREMIEMKKIQEHPEYVHELVEFSSEALEEKYRTAPSVPEKIFYGYLWTQKKNFGLDYDDLILLTLKIFDENEEIARKWQERFEYIMIDEFQDIDALQYRLMESLCSVHKNLFVVGDPDQTIYTWRGASVRFLLDFADHFPGTQTVFLNENYRSTPQILHAANELIARNKNRIDKRLVPALPDGSAIRAGHFEDAEKEGAAIAARILQLNAQGIPLKDMAILYRSHFLSRSIEDALCEADIPYAICSGTPFFSRAEIKTAQAYCRMLLYKNDLDFLRTINTPVRNIGKTRIAFLKAYAAEKEVSLYEALVDNLETPRFASTQAADYVELIESTQWQDRLVSRVLDEVLERSGYEKDLRLKGAQERLDDLAELKQAAAQYELSWGEETTLESWLTHTALFSGGDTGSELERIRLMTIHNAKGLEFDAVFLPGLNEGIFPSRKTRSADAMEEERRLAFVGLTRAKKELFVSEAGGTTHSGTSRMPSRFLLEIADAGLEWNPPLPEDLKEAAGRMISLRNAAIPQTGSREADLKEGDRVEHAVFGQGVLLSIDPDAGKLMVQFDTLKTRRVLSAKARLKKIDEKTSTQVLH